jgi:hypothetical protein
MTKHSERARKSHALRACTEAQLSGLRASTAARRQATVERLQSAIDALKAKKQTITVQAIYEECGLRYAAIHRNPEALALFRANSSHLLAQKKRARRRKSSDPEEGRPLRDPLLNYNKPQLVARLREARKELNELRQHQVTLVEAGLEREKRIAELEAALASLEPYRAFVEQVRLQMRQEEQGRFGDLPPPADG